MLKPPRSLCLILPLLIGSWAVLVYGLGMEEPEEVLSLGAPEVLFDGTSLDRWHFYCRDDSVAKSDVCSIEDGVLQITGRPSGYLATKRWYRDYVLELEWRWQAGSSGGNSGVLVHTTAPLLFFGWPRSLEVQLQAGHAGDFWVIGKGVDLRVEDERARRRSPRPGDQHTHRRVRNLTDGSERPIGSWNSMRVVCRDTEIEVFVNGELVNHGTACTETEGAIALQSEGTPIEFRSIRLTPLQQ